MPRINPNSSFHDQSTSSGSKAVAGSHQDTQFTYTFENFFHPFVGDLISRLNQDLLQGMLEGQLDPDVKFFDTTYPKPDDRLVQRVSFPKKIDVEEHGVYANYNWELFFHIPLTVAVHLSKTQRYAEAQRWFHYIFDPTSNDRSVDPPKRFWKFLAFRQDLDPKQIDHLLTLLSQSPTELSTDDQQRQADVHRGYQAMLNGPFQPYAVARTRHMAYQYCVVMKYLDNLIAWGDNLFQQDTVESINEATLLYVLAANVLGSRPQRIPPRGTVQPKTFAQLKKAGLDAMGNALVELEGQFPFNLAPPLSGGNGNPDSVTPLFGIGSTLYFCIPRNNRLLAYWDIVADRLFKIRHCRNVEGVVRPLALFDPPLDPGMLVKAAAAGIDIGGIVSGLNQPIGPVRCLTLIQKALELCGEVRGLGNALLSALEKGDSEHLALVRQRHEIQLQQMTQEVRFLQWKSAEEATQSLLTSRATVLERLNYYKRLLGLSPDPQSGPLTLPLDNRELTEENFDEAYSALVEKYDKALTLQGFPDLEVAVDTSDPPAGQKELADLNAANLNTFTDIRNVFTGVGTALREITSTVRDITRVTTLDAPIPLPDPNAIPLSLPGTDNVATLTGLISGDSSDLQPSGQKGQGNLYLNPSENVDLNKHGPQARIARLTSMAIDTQYAALALLPSVNLDVAFWGIGGHATVFGGSMLAGLGHFLSSIANMAAIDEEGQAVRASKVAGYQRRGDEWILQHNLAAHELMQNGRQILTSLIAEQVARHEYVNVKQQIANSQEVDQFLHDKFTNEELYLWMQGEISRLYYDYYRFAFDTARKAERTMKQELMRPELDAQDFVKFNYWDGGRKGLLSGEALHLDVKRMEMAYHDNNKRELELTRHISLRQLDPLALLNLKVIGSCTVTIPEWLYDRDCPGHYMRRIKSVALSIPSVVGPYTSVNCTLSLLRSSLRKSPIAGNDYARQGSEDDRFVDYTGGVQSIVTSAGSNDSGLFETSLRDERFLPFEGAGAESTWKLELPADYRAFDYSTISDVILHIRYTARQGVDRDKVKKALDAVVNEANQSGLTLFFSLRHDFPTEWAAFVNGTGADPFVVRLRKDFFPYFVQGKTLRTGSIDQPSKARIELYAVSGGTVAKSSVDVPNMDSSLNGANGFFDLSLAPDAVLKRDAAAQVFLVIRYSL